MDDLQQFVDPDGALTITLSFALACKHLTEYLGETPAYWAKKFGNQAGYMINSEEVHPDEIERICAETFWSCPMSPMPDN